MHGFAFLLINGRLGPLQATRVLTAGGFARDSRRANVEMTAVPFQPEIFALDGLADTLLIGPSALFGRGGDFACGSDDEVRRRLLLLLPDRGTVPALRRAFERWRLGEGFAYLSDRMLVDRVAAATRRGRLSAFVVPNAPLKSVLRPDTPRAAYVLASFAPRVQGTAAARAAPLPRSGQPAAASATSAASPAATRTAAPSQPTPRRVDALSFEERLIEVLRRTVESKRLSEAARNELKKLLDPAMLALTVAVLLVWAGSHAFGIGFIADAFLLGASIFFVGRGAFEAAENIQHFLIVLRDARIEADLTEAADLLARAIAAVGVKLFMAAVTRGAARVSSKGIPARSGKRPYEEPRPAPTRLQQRSTGGSEPPREGTGFLGRSGFELKNAPYQAVRNAPAAINGRKFSGHALDQMQNRGIMPSVVDNAIRTGSPFSTRPGTTGYYDVANNIMVIVNAESGQVVTAIRGAPR